MRKETPHTNTHTHRKIESEIYGQRDGGKRKEGERTEKVEFMVKPCLP